MAVPVRAGVAGILVALLTGCLAVQPDAPAAPAAGPQAGFWLSAEQDLAEKGPFAAEPTVAVRGDGRAIVVADFVYRKGDDPTQDMRFDVTIHRSFDGGANWTLSELPRSVLAPLDPTGLLNCVGDPVLAYGPKGELYLAGVAAQCVWKRTPAGPPVILLSDLSVFVTRSDDDGGSWSPALFHQRGIGAIGTVQFAAGFYDKDWVAVGPDGVVHLAYNDDTATQFTIAYTRSEDMGKTWANPVTAYAPGQGRSVMGASLAAGENRRLYLAFSEFPTSELRTGPSGDGQVLVLTSHDGGGSFGAPVKAGAGGWTHLPRIAADANDADHVVVAGSEDADADISHVYLAESRDGAKTFSAPLVLAPARSKQKEPAVWIDDAGRSRVAYYDGSWPGGERCVVDVAKDGAVLFEETPTGNATSPGFARRDYLGMDGRGQTAWFAWVAGDSTSTRIGVSRISG